MVPDVRINQYQEEIQPDYFQGSLKGLTGGKSEWFSLFPFIWSFTIPFKNLEACWEEHPVSSYLLPSSRWNKSDTIFSDWLCLSGWPLLYFYSTTSSWKISVYIKRTSTNVCIFVLICLSACSVVQIFCNPLSRHDHQQWSSCTFLGQLSYKVTPSFAKLYLLSWYWKDLSISDWWLTLCLYTISHKEA